MHLDVTHAAFIKAASGRNAARSRAAAAFAAMHVRYLLGDLAVDADLPVPAIALLAPWTSR